MAELSKILKGLEGKLSRRDVHRLRVTTRRLRSLGAVLAKTRLKKRSRRIQKYVKNLTYLLGEVRSLDVSLKLWKKRSASNSLPLPQGIERALKKAARQARQRLSQEVGSSQRTALREKIEKMLPRLAEAQVDCFEAWEKCRGQAEARAARKYASYRKLPDIEVLHELRIRFKQWRYLLELGELEAPETRKIEALKTLQDDIGELHDLEVLRGFLGQGFLKKMASTEAARYALKEERRALKMEVEAGQQNFLSRQGRALDILFPQGDRA